MSSKTPDNTFVKVASSSNMYKKALHLSTALDLDSSSIAYNATTMAPLRPSWSTQGVWTCVTCTKDYNTADKDMPWKTTQEDALVCVPCIQGRFEEALQNDYSWPPRFGGEALEIAEFRLILSKDLLDRLTAKAEEVAANRDTLFPAGVDGQTRGKDYQVCPGCSKIVQLRDGCNHIVCVCLTGFCFICGTQVTHGSDHWAFTQGTPSTCPRFGQPNSDRAIFDGHPVAGLVNALFGAGGPLVVAEQNIAAVAGEIEQMREQMRLIDAQLRANETERQRQLRRLALFDGINLARWAWNVAMQNLPEDPGMHQMPRETLRAAELPVAARTRAGRRRAHEAVQPILAALREHNPEHAVEQQEWEALFDNHIREVTDLVQNGNMLTDEAQTHPFLQNGLLLRPVAGVFNMVAQDSREAALEWMYNTIRDYNPATHNGTDIGAAVFAMGPGGNENTRIEVARMLRDVRDQGTFGRFTVTVMQNAGLLVQIQPPHPIVFDEEEVERNILAGNDIGFLATPPEGYWRVDLLLGEWGHIVHLDRARPFQPVFVPMQRNWGFMMRAARGAYLQQDPERATQMFEALRAQN